MKLTKLIKIDEDKCVNCHVCIAVCPVKYPNDGSGNVVKIIDDLCIGCGECIRACTHKARSGIDDFDAALTALQNNEPVVAIVAPATAANFPSQYLRLNGWLKSLGVQAVFDVSFGAELTVKSYLEYIKSHNPSAVIAQPCPAIVSYIEIYRPELLAYLAPADSPMTHTMKMIREFYPGYKNHKILVISPCIAKKREFSAVGLGDFNVTMTSLESYLQANRIDLARFPESDFDNDPAERAVLFSTSGGLLRTAEREIPEIRNKTRRIEGPQLVYEYLNCLQESIGSGMNPLLIDCLNCEMGCNGGTGTRQASKNPDIVEHRIEERSKTMIRLYQAAVSPGEFLARFIQGKQALFKKLRRTINKYWKHNLYRRHYTDLSGLRKERIKMPDNNQLQAIYKSMNKMKASDIKNCASCGYKSCELMAIAVFNGLNKPENCHFYLVSGYELEKTGREELIQNLTTESAYIAALITKIINSIENLTAQIEEQYVALEQFILLTKEMIDFIHSSHEFTHQKKTAISMLIDMSKAGAEKIDHNKLTLMEIARSTDDIIEMINLTDDIIARTNILAFNAAIQATHAGRFGKGFNVVADEIKKLADSAANNTTNIGSSLREAIRKMEYSITSGNETYETFTKLSSGINTVTETFHFITDNMQTLSGKGNELMQTITHFSSIADKVKTNSNEITDNIKSIKHSLAKLSGPEK